jgi:TonB family protein
MGTDVMKRMLIAALAFAGPLITTPALAYEAPTFTDTAWILVAPTFADVVAAYPEKARAKGLAGEVRLDCSFDAAGRLGHCEVMDETPVGARFGYAALGLAQRFQGAPRLNGHSIAGARAQLWFRFAPDMLTGTNVPTPEWAALPGAAQFQAAFPDAAAKAGVLKARAAMSCTVGPDGGLLDCAAVSEDPVGYGFGASTLPLAPLFKVRLWGSDGRPVVGGAVRVPIRYDLQQAPSPKS